jgi:hypothetical protein
MRNANRELDIILDEEEEADLDTDIPKEQVKVRKEDGSICFFRSSLPVSNSS